MEILIISVAVIIVTVLIMSWRHHVRLKAFLLSPIHTDEGILSKVKRLVDIDDAAVAGITLFDVLYSTLRLNPDLLGRLGEIDYSQPLTRISDLISNSGPNNLNMDAVSDVWQHFDYLDAKTDMAIYNPVETTAAFGDDPIGTIDSVFSFGDTADLAAGAHDATLDMADLHGLFFHIPIYAITVKSIRNWQKVVDNHVTVPEAVGLTLVDATASTAGAIGGFKLGAKFGAILAPKTFGVSLVLGPLIGSAIGLVSGKWLSTKFKIFWHGGDFRDAQRNFERDLRNLKYISALFRNEFLRNFTTIRKALSSKHRSNIQMLKLRRQLNENLLKRLFFPNAISKALSMGLGEMKKEFRLTTKPYYEKLRVEAAQSPEFEGGLLIYAQGKGKLMRIERLEEIYDQITPALEELENKKGKLLREKTLLEQKL